MNRLFDAVIRSLVLSLICYGASASEPVPIEKALLGEPVLLQTSYEREDGWQEFLTSRSRIVTFRRNNGTLRMTSPSRTPGSVPGLVTVLPIQAETASAFLVSFDAAFERIVKQEDRTGEDYYLEEGNRADEYLRLFQRRIVSVSRKGEIMVLRQKGFDEHGRRVLVHYYLQPYRRSPHFRAFEVQDLKHFGFYQTYPRRRAEGTVSYAMKFDVDEPIVFALSAAIPSRFRQAVRDGVLYWNEALGRPLLRLMDAPEGVTAPDPEYNVIQWTSGRSLASTSHIQGDPLTGEILHAHVYIRSDSIEKGDPDERDDYLRHLVAHEIGHALGLRHNFASGPASTVMNYFGFARTIQIGRQVILPGSRALEYDQKVIRHVYLGEPLNTNTLPPFCTDSQSGCLPFKRLHTAAQ